MKKKILVIDDNPVVTRLNESLLTSGGYDVVIAMNGIEGIEMAKLEKPDVILLDLILPEKHGFEVCKELKQGEGTQHIPIIIVTGSGLEDVAKEEPNVQASGYIAKPYGFEDLDTAIKQAIGQG